MRVMIVKWSPSAPNLAELVQDYQTATERYGEIVRYLGTAMEVLTKPKCQLFMEITEIEKNRCQRQQRKIRDRLEVERRRGA